MSASEFSTVAGGGAGDTGNTDEGLWDDLAGSVDESIARQFDDEQGGGFADPDTYRTEGDRAEFGDGSNQWLPGTFETLNNPVDRATDPWGTITGAADAAALNFDEGVGGLSSLIDDEPGNTAGSGQSSITSLDPSNLTQTQLALAGGMLVLLLIALGPSLQAGATAAAAASDRG